MEGTHANRSGGTTAIEAVSASRLATPATFLEKQDRPLEQRNAATAELAQQ